jgi:hypothetical protein
MTFTKKVKVPLTVARNGFSFRNATAIWVKRRFTRHEIFGRNLQNGVKKHIGDCRDGNLPLYIKIVKLFYKLLPFFVPHGEDSISPISTVWLRLRASS